jgi:hypothetical protein
MYDIATNQTNQSSGGFSIGFNIANEANATPLGALAANATYNIRFEGLFATPRALPLAAQLGRAALNNPTVLGSVAIGGF